MKTILSVVALAVVIAAVTLSLKFHLFNPVPAQTAARPEGSAAVTQRTAVRSTGNANGPSKPAVSGAQSAGETDPRVQSLAAAVEAVSSSQVGFRARQAIWAQLKASGQLDAAIVALKRMAIDDPKDATVELALGEAEVNQLSAIAQAGAPFNEKAILALQADQDFSAALANDPSNWEAQYEKAVALSHWPASLDKGSQVVSLLSGLVSQQATMSPQPEFAETYVALGQQYQASGQSGKALETWQQGLALFPLNANLQGRLAQAATP